MERYTDQSSRPSLNSAVRSSGAEDEPVRSETVNNRRTRNAKKGRQLNLKAALGAVLLVAVVGFIWWSVGKLGSSMPSFIDTSKYQSVLLTNNNAFYGKVSEMTAEHIILKDVFYIQQPTSTEGDNANKFELIKRGDELHGPVDTMLINRAQVVYVENLKDDGKVAQTIKSYQSNKP